MLVADIAVLLIPLWILLGLIVLLGILGLLGRIKGGRYLKPLFELMAKVPFLKRQLEKASKAAIERTNPELASAMRKIEPFTLGSATTRHPAACNASPTATTHWRAGVRMAAS